jgi:hypothetical protein
MTRRYAAGAQETDSSMTRHRPRPRVRRRKPLLRRALRAWRTAPRALRLAVGMMLAVLLWAAANWAYQALRKPTELLFPVSTVLAKTPIQTWQEYGPQFRRHATAVITAEFLAALAQIESAGNPLVRTYWRWYPTWHPLQVYRPASSAVGMYQITDGTFAQARPECLRDPIPSGNAKTTDPDSCWLEGLYSRVMPGDAIALTAQHLDRTVAAVLKRKGTAKVTLQQKQDLAAVVHLCGSGAAAAYARRGFRPAPGQRCGDHDVQEYLARFNAIKRRFARLAGAD